MNSLLLERPVDNDMFAYECAKLDYEICMEESMALLDLIDFRESLNQKRAELKVYSESGTAADLAALYTEAGAEASGQGEGILKTIWNKIKNFISDIMTAFSNIFKKHAVDPNRKLNAPSEFAEKDAQADKVKDILKKVSAIVALLAGGAAIAVCVKKWDAIKESVRNLGETLLKKGDKATKKATKYSKKDLKKMQDQIDNNAKRGTDMETDDEDDGEIEGTKSSDGFIKTTWGKVTKTANKFTEILNLSNKIVDDCEKTEKAISPDDPEKTQKIGFLREVASAVKTAVDFVKDVPGKILSLIPKGDNSDSKSEPEAKAAGSAPKTTKPKRKIGGKNVDYNAQPAQNNFTSDEVNMDSGEEVEYGDSVFESTEMDDLMALINSL